MKIDSAALTQTTANSQVSSKQDEQKLKSFSDSLEKAKDEGDDDELKKAADQFEAFFLNEIFKSMRKSSEWGEGLTEKSHARGIYESMFDEKISDEISTGRGIGIGDMIYKQMSKQYGKSDAVTDQVESDDKKEIEDVVKTSKSIDIKG